MGQLVDQRLGRVPGDDRVGVHLFDHDAVVFDAVPRYGFQTVQEGDCVSAAVRLHEPNDHVGAAVVAPVRFLEHRVGLAHAGGHAEVEPQPAARGMLLCLQSG